MSNLLLNHYMKICKAYPSTIRLNQVGGFIEALGIDAHHLNRLKDFTITKRTMKGSEFKMAGFPMYSKDGIIDDLISNRSRIAIYLQAENNSKETLKTTATRILDKFISPGLAPLHSDYNFGPLCAIEIHGKEIELFFIDLTNGSSFKHLLPMSQKAVAEIMLITQPSEIIINGKLLNEDIYFGPNSYNPLMKIIHRLRTKYTLLPIAISILS
jgi:DNA mismatch repair ATPase MutS